MAKISKKDKRRLLFGLLVLCTIVLTLCGFLFGYWKDILNNKKETEKLLTKYNDLLEEESDLNSTITKMQDSDYVAEYAREKYKISKDNEIIIKVEN